MVATKLIIFLVIGIVVAALILAFVLPRLYPMPLWNPYGGGEKERFIRYLTCAIAKCLKGCGSKEVAGVGLEKGETGEYAEFCDDTCSEMGTLDNPVYICEDKFEFTFKENVVYDSTIGIHTDLWGDVYADSSVTLLMPWKGIYIDENCLDYSFKFEGHMYIWEWDKEDLPYTWEPARHAGGILISSYFCDTYCTGVLYRAGGAQIHATPQTCIFQEGTRIIIWAAPRIQRQTIDNPWCTTLIMGSPEEL
jgi:hypothetical protein